MIRSENTVAVPPGSTIREQLQNRGMTQKEFAVRMEMSPKHISKLINGEVQLTSDMAMRLESVLGIPAVFWSNLEAIYRDKIVKVKNENEMEKDMEYAIKFPYLEMAKKGWVPKTRSRKEKVFNLRAFFEVVRLGLLKEQVVPNMACRRLAETEKGDFALMAWSQKARMIARDVKTEPINLQKLKKSLLKIREMTNMDPEEFCPILVRILADSGVALVFLPNIGGSFLHGATFIDNGKIVMALSDRGKYADKFWFSIFHEIGHVLEGHLYSPDGIIEKDEDDADSFAGNLLIPSPAYDVFKKKNDYSIEAILRFSEEIGVDEGIVVGRLQKDGYISYAEYNNLRKQYEIPC